MDRYGAHLYVNILHVQILHVQSLNVSLYIYFGTGDNWQVLNLTGIKSR